MRLRLLRHFAEDIAFLRQMSSSSLGTASSAPSASVSDPGALDPMPHYGPPDALNLMLPSASHCMEKIDQHVASANSSRLSYVPPVASSSSSSSWTDPLLLSSTSQASGAPLTGIEDVDFLAAAAAERGFSLDSVFQVWMKSFMFEYVPLQLPFEMILSLGVHVNLPTPSKSHWHLFHASIRAPHKPLSGSTPPAACLGGQASHFARCPCA